MVVEANDLLYGVIITMSTPDSNLGEAEWMRLFLRHEQELRAYARALLPTWEAVEDTPRAQSRHSWCGIGPPHSRGVSLVIVSPPCTYPEGGSRKPIVDTDESAAPEAAHFLHFV